jgi:hypothetical protein
LGLVLIATEGMLANAWSLGGDKLSTVVNEWLKQCHGSSTLPE